MKLKLLMGVAVLLLLTGCNRNYKLAQTQKPFNKMHVSSRSIEYLILCQDRLEVLLYKDPNQDSLVSMQELGQPMYKKGILVDTHGNVILPLIGKVYVRGLTQTQAANKITQMYKKYVNTPSVYVEVMNKRLIVLGEVKKPGPITIDKEKMTLFEALAFAGDITDAAVRNDIIILSHTPEKGMMMRHVDLTRFDKMHYADIMLRPNDIVYVQPDNWKEYRVSSDNFTSIFRTISEVASPFVNIKYLTD